MSSARRDTVTFVLIIVTVAAMSAVGLYAQDNPYRVVEDWAKLREGRTWGSTTAVDVDANDHIWVAKRCGANSCADSSLAPILEFDPSGRLLRSFGAGLFVFPHGIGMDKKNNVWVTDGQGKDGKDHQVFKFSPDGRILMTLGKAGVTGDGPDTFNQPSDVAVAPNGDIFVADGHGKDSNARIVKFSKDGRFIKAWGKKGIVPGSSTRRTVWPLIPRDGSSSLIGTTIASRSSIRKESSSSSGRNSAGRAGFSSTRRTIFTSPTPSQILCGEIRAGSAGSGSATSVTALSRRSSQIRSRMPRERAPRKAWRQIPGAIFTAQKSAPRC